MTDATLRSDAHLIKANAIKQFQRIGTSMPNTQAPQSNDNRSGLAFEYFIADSLKAVAEKRRDAAKAACLEAGVFIAPHELSVGEERESFRDDNIVVTGKKANPATRIDKTELFNVLAKKYGAEEARSIIAQATKENAPSVTYSVAVR